MSVSSDQNANTGGYTGFLINTEQLVRNTLTRTTKSAVQSLAELVANSIDAQATKIELVFDRSSFMIIVKDDGFGIEIKEWLILIGGNQKSKQRQLDKRLDSSGEFGEGMKTMLAYCNEMVFKSSWLNIADPGKSHDVYAHLRSPLRYKDFNQLVLTEYRSYMTLNDRKGTVVLVKGMKESTMTSVISSMKEVLGRKFAWIIASGKAKITYTIQEQDPKLTDIFGAIKLPDRVNNLLNHPKMQEAVIGKDGEIEIMTMPVTSAKDRKILKCCHHVTVKEDPTEYNCFAMVNYNKLLVTRDRTAYDTDDYAAIYLEQQIEQFLSKHFTKTEISVGKKAKRQTVTLLNALNLLAEKVGLKQKPTGPEIGGMFSPPRQGTLDSKNNGGYYDYDPNEPIVMNPDPLNGDEFIQTTRKNKHYEEIEEFQQVWIKTTGNITEKGKDDDDEENEDDGGGVVVGGRPPHGKGGNGENTLNLGGEEDPTLLTIKVLPYGEKKEKKQVAMRASRQKKTPPPTTPNQPQSPGVAQEGYFGMIYVDDEDEPRNIWEVMDATGAAIVINQAREYYQSAQLQAKTDDIPVFQLIPLIANAVVPILHGHNLSAEEHKVKANEILNYVAKAFNESLMDSATATTAAKKKEKEKQKQKEKHSEKKDKQER